MSRMNYRTLNLVAIVGTLALSQALGLCPQVAQANITLVGNTNGDPSFVPLNPCPAHGPDANCESALVPSSVMAIASPSEWFRNTLQAAYPASGNWHFNYVGGNANVVGTFNVDFYRAYNDCPGLMGAEIQVTFNPDPSSPVKNLLWIQTYSEQWPGHTGSAVDDRAHLDPADQPGTMFGPFYPFQKSDTTLGYQTNTDYSSFYDKPGSPCPAPGTTESVRFETYIASWDDYFNADGTITDVGNDGHNVYIHEGFEWGYDLNCTPVPVPPAVWSGLVGLSAIGALTSVRRNWRRLVRP